MDELKNQPATSDVLVRAEETFHANEQAKKLFVEPAISVPVDVLETTSFFMLQTSIDTADV